MDSITLNKTDVDQVHATNYASHIQGVVERRVMPGEFTASYTAKVAI
ncbi:MAG: hypothetical protein WA108_03890 [Thiobacillus sp.]